MKERRGKTRGESESEKWEKGKKDRGKKRTGIKENEKEISFGIWYIKAHIRSTSWL